MIWNWLVQSCQLHYLSLEIFKFYSIELRVRLRCYYLMGWYKLDVQMYTSRTHNWVFIVLPSWIFKFLSQHFLSPVTHRATLLGPLGCPRTSCPFIVLYSNPPVAIGGSVIKINIKVSWVTLLCTEIVIIVIIINNYVFLNRY